MLKKCVGIFQWHALANHHAEEEPISKQEMGTEAREYILCVLNQMW